MGIVAVVATAQMLVQVGANAVPALLPVFIAEWSLSYTEAGWLTGIYFGAYAASVPILVSLTDRIDPRRIYLTCAALTALAMLSYGLLARGFWTAVPLHALMGIGWAGNYMPGLKMLTDLLRGTNPSRAVSVHAAGVSIGGALSYVMAGKVATWLGWPAVFATGALCASLAFLLVFLGVPAQASSAAATGPARLLDLGPVLRNRSAMAYSLGYMVHSWEMFAFRSWVVAFLTFAAGHTDAASVLLTPATVATLVGMVGVPSTLLGNELAIRYGRRRFIVTVMVLSMVAASTIGFTSISYPLAAVLAVLYSVLIWSDSSTLTAGTLGSALPSHRGRTIALHSTLGYGSGFVSPLVFGAILDWAGGETASGWGFAFGHLALVMIAGPLILTLLRPADLPGDRPSDRRSPAATARP